MIRDTSDVRKAKREGKLGVIISFEGGAVVPRDDGDLQCGTPPIKDECMSKVRALHDLGLREFQPYHASCNWLKEDPKNGEPNSEFWPLNHYGVRVLHEMDRLGVAIDLSHMGPTPFQQALKETHKPFILSDAAVARVSLCGKDHDCAALRQWESGGKRELGPPGNTTMLDDATINAVARRRGVIALHFMDQLVSRAKFDSKTDATIVDLVDEVEYIVNNFGVDYVALGPDYFPSNEQEAKWVNGARNMAEMENVVKEMVRRKWSDLRFGKFSA